MLVFRLQESTTIQLNTLVHFAFGSQTVPLPSSPVDTHSRSTVMMNPIRSYVRVTLLLALGLIAGCEGGASRRAGGVDTAQINADADTGRGDAAGRAVAATADPGGAVRFDYAAWKPPALSELPNDSLGAAVRRGLAIMMHTPDSLPRYAPGKIACTNCHLDGGRNPDASPLTGTHARFPKFMERTGAVIGLADRVNYCFTRSLAGSMLPPGSREMQDILAYIAWLSRGVPVGANLPGAQGMPKMPDGIVGDTTRGADVFATTCIACHGQSGSGNPGIPAVWGPKSYSIGASMGREERAASFIWHNMPLGKPRSLTHQQAFDVAAYINSRPRPDSPGKEDDWPIGGAPKDVPYATAGRKAYRPPARLLPRANPRASIVPPPKPAGSSR